LGKKLLLRIADIMHTGDEVPMVEENSPMEDTIFEITSKKLGVTAVVDEEGRLVGIITDGDLRRLIERTKNIWGLCAKDVMTRNPKTIAEDELAVYGVKKMEEHSITSLIITDGQRKVKGIVHLHDILKAGIVEQLWSK
jgi:arabinose-5-phosphate isomerase